MGGRTAMTFTAAEIQAAIEKIELLADQDRSASYAPILARLDAEARIARRAAAPIRRAPIHQPRPYQRETAAP